MGEVGDSADDDSGSDPGWEDGARRSCCCGSLYMRTLIAGVVLLVMACVITGGVVGWQMKAKYALLPLPIPYLLPLTLTLVQTVFPCIPLRSCYGVFSS